jgi:transposase-like protein
LLAFKLGGKRLAQQDNDAHRAKLCDRARYAVSYRDLEEILAERGVAVDHATLNRWVVKYSPLIAANTQTKKRPTASTSLENP